MANSVPRIDLIPELKPKGPATAGPFLIYYITEYHFYGMHITLTGYCNDYCVSITLTVSEKDLLPIITTRNLLEFQPLSRTLTEKETFSLFCISPFLLSNIS
jgi:hypothetical protein